MQRPRVDPRKVEEAARLFAQANGSLNLMLVRRRLSVAGMRQAADWAFRGARMIRDQGANDGEDSE